MSKTAQVTVLMGAFSALVLLAALIGAASTGWAH